MKKVLNSCCFVCLLLVPLLVVSGCAVKEKVTGVSNVFLEDVDIKAKRDNLPFQHTWVNPTFNKADFKYVYFKPVRTDLLPKGQWERSANAFVKSEKQYLEKAAEIALYFGAKLKEKTKYAKNRKLTVVDHIGPNTAVVEIVLTELELSHPVARAASLAAPVPGTGPALTAISDPHLAFAARITNGETGELIATAADRRFPPIRIIDLNKLTVSSSAREISATWADEMARAIQGDMFTKIKKKRFDWKPW